MGLGRAGSSKDVSERRDSIPGGGRVVHDSLAGRGGGYERTHGGRSGCVEADLVADGQDVVKLFGGEGHVAEGFEEPQGEGP